MKAITNEQNVIFIHLHVLRRILKIFSLYINMKIMYKRYMQFPYTYQTVKKKKKPQWINIKAIFIYNTYKNLDIKTFITK